MSEVILNEENFEEEVIKSDIPVLVDFYADWCGPCKMLAPVIEQLAGELEGQVKICKVNIDNQPPIASRFGVVSIPTVIVFEGGEVKNKSVGFVPKDKLMELLG